MATAQHGGHADEDVLRAPCLFVSANSLPVAANLHTGAGFFSVSAGGNHTCGVQANETVQCWGWNSDGQATPPDGRFVAVSAGTFHTCGVRTDNTVQCWGRDQYGPTTPSAGRFVAVSAGTFHTCGVRTDNTVQCWGRD